MSPEEVTSSHFGRIRFKLTYRPDPSGHYWNLTMAVYVVTWDLRL